MLGVKKEDSTKNMAVIWVTGSIKFAALEYSTYKSWNDKVNCKIDVLEELKNYLKIKGILSQDWEKVNDFWISISLTKSHIKDQNKLMNDEDKKEWIKSLRNIEKLFFTYDDIANSNLNLGYDIKEFS